MCYTVRMIPNDVKHGPRTSVITISSKTYGEHEVWVDMADYDLVRDYRWTLRPSRGTFYAQTNIPLADGTYTTLQMHRLLAPTTTQIYHRDRNGLNNTRANLREATGRVNALNRRLFSSNKSGYRGVYWLKSKSRWIAQLKVNGKTAHRSSHHTPEDAAKAYDRAARVHNGVHAQLNFPEEM